MITAFKLYEKLIGEANTHQGGHAKPNRNFIDWVNTISIDIFNDLVAEFEKSNVISEMLTVFLKTKNVVVTPVPSQMWDLVTFPTDYNYFATASLIRKGDKSCGCKCYDTCGDIKEVEEECSILLDDDEMEALKIKSDKELCEFSIDKVRTAQWEAICKHKTMPPSIKSPKCTQFERGLKLAPKGLGIIVMNYFRKPKEAEFLYTITNPGLENEYIQFDPNSQPLEWDDKMIPEFIARLKEKYGTFIREQFVQKSGVDNQKV